MQRTEELVNYNSMRGSDIDAVIYQLARMLQGSEETIYISRRLLRFARLIL